MADSTTVTVPGLSGEDEASAAVRRGLALLAVEQEAAWKEALACFDHALELRRTQPLEDQPWLRWGVTAAWMNRAEALHRLGRHEPSLKSYDEALRHLQLLPLDAEPAFRWRLGLAWMNRAEPLQALGQLETAAASLEQAIAVLDHPQLSTLRDLGTLASAWGNFARLRLAQDQPLLALTAASRAIGVLAPAERRDAAAAGVTLQARHAGCEAVARLLEAGCRDAGQAEAWIHEATDWVESALDLTAFWQGRDFGDLPVQLFRFGCRIYLAYQPQFLGEFLVDVLRPRLRRQPVYFQAAEEALQTAATVLRARGPGDLGLRRLDDLLALLQRLEQAAQQIRSWQQDDR
jgi:tetratricopeptide (TPR) repeat protein